MTLRYVLLPLGLLQILVPALPALVSWQSTIGESPADPLLRAPESPPGPFFAIWGVIFTFYLAFAIYAALHDSQLSRRLAPPLALAAIFSVSWMLIVQSVGQVAAAHPVLLALTASTFWAAYRFDQMRGLGGSAPKFIADGATGLFAGWMTLATAISQTDFTRDLLGMANTDAVWWFLLHALAIAVLGALFVFARISRSPFYVIALAWGLAGVILNLWTLTGLHVPAVVTAAIAFALLAFRMRHGANGALRTMT